MDRIQRRYSRLLFGLGGRQSLSAIPAEKLATIKEQYEKLKGQLRTVLTFRTKPPAG